MKKGQPVIGYYGALAKWFDYDLLKKIDQENKYQVVLFGIKYDDSYDKSGADQWKNVHFCGSRPYEILQNYAARMDVLTIPFLINDITKATSPFKLFEYMALNKEFLEQLDKAILLKTDETYKALLDKEALENTWEEKARTILEQLKKYE